MFVAPVVSESKFDYEAIMRQAVGRCHRFGQKSDVHVYHFAMERTAEVNILETHDKDGKVIVRARDGMGIEWVSPDDVFENGVVVRERLQGPALNALADALDDDDADPATEGGQFNENGGDAGGASAA